MSAYDDPLTGITASNGDTYFSYSSSIEVIQQDETIEIDQPKKELIYCSECSSIDSVSIHDYLFQDEWHSNESDSANGHYDKIDYTYAENEENYKYKGNSIHIGAKLHPRYIRKLINDNSEKDPNGNIIQWGTFSTTSFDFSGLKGVLIYNMNDRSLIEYIDFDSPIDLTSGFWKMSFPDRYLITDAVQANYSAYGSIIDITANEE